MNGKIVIESKEEFHNGVGKMNNSYEEFNTNINNAFLELDSMNEDWTGKVRNEFVVKLNDDVSPIVNQTTAAMRDIVATAQSDGRAYFNSDNTSWREYSIIPEKNVVVIASSNSDHLYVAPSISDRLKNVSTEIDKAINASKECYNAFNNIGWSSAARETVDEAFINCHEKINTTLEDLKSQVNKFVEEFQGGVGEAEAQSNQV